MPSFCAAKQVFVQGLLAPIPEKTILHGSKNTLLAPWRYVRCRSAMLLLGFKLFLWTVAVVLAAVKFVQKWRNGGFMQAISLPKGVFFGLLLIAGLAVSSLSLYFNYRPRTITKEKIVEKPVEKIVEKTVLVPQDCPVPHSPSKTTSKTEHPQKSPPVPFSQNCPNGICNAGDNLGSQTVNNFTPPERHLTSAQVDAIDVLAQSLPDDAPKWFTVESLNTREAVTFGDEIQRILKKHHKTDAGVVVWLSARPPFPSGVVVVVQSEQDEHFKIAQQIATSIEVMGLPKPSFTGGAGLRAGQVKIIVGTP